LFGFDGEIISVKLGGNKKQNLWRRHVKTGMLLNMRHGQPFDAHIEQ